MNCNHKKVLIRIYTLASPQIMRSRHSDIQYIWIQVFLLNPLFNETVLLTLLPGPDHQHWAIGHALASGLYAPGTSLLGMWLIIPILIRPFDILKRICPVRDLFISSLHDRKYFPGEREQLFLLYNRVSYFKGSFLWALDSQAVRISCYVQPTLLLLLKGLSVLKDCFFKQLPMEKGACTHSGDITASSNTFHQVVP